ncbi:hypothetical protein [Streptomyces sp. NPDC048663]|uniref:hypothetical protein n=1 Tax=Streptomyces sp. NPDC048663 TaxID=3155638 RepID=UPI0034450D03
MAETMQTAGAPASPRTRGWCHWHKGLGEHLQMIQAVEGGSGPGASFYACCRCRARFSLVPFGEQR